MSLWGVYVLFFHEFSDYSDHFTWGGILFNSCHDIGSSQSAPNGEFSYLKKCYGKSFQHRLVTDLRPWVFANILRIWGEMRRGRCFSASTWKVSSGTLAMEGAKCKQFMDLWGFWFVCCYILVQLFFWCVELNKFIGRIRKGGKSNSSVDGLYVQKALGHQACKKNLQKHSVQIYSPHMSESVWFTMYISRSCSLPNITVQSHYMIIEIWSQLFSFNYCFSLALNKSEILQVKVKKCKSFL